MSKKNKHKNNQRPGNQSNTQDKKKERNPNRGSFWVAIIAVVVAIISPFIVDKISEKNTQAEIRPYVQVTGAKFNDLKVDSPYNLKLEIVNTGKSPAYNVNLVDCQLTYSGSVNFKSNWTDSAGAKISNTNFYIGANSNFDNNMQFDRALSKEDSIRILKNEGLLTFTGDINYKDIYKEDHMTRFYLKFDPHTQEFVFYKDFNEADRKPYD